MLQSKESRKTFLRNVRDVAGFAPGMAVVCAWLYKVGCSLTHAHTSTGNSVISLYGNFTIFYKAISLHTF